MPDYEPMLRELLSDVAKDQNYKDATINVNAISSGGANYTSVLFHATISTPNKKELKLFAKVGNLNEKTRGTVPSFIFDTERFVYRDLANIFKRIEQNAEIPEEERYVFPKVYGYNPNIYEETIVLENLVAQGYGVYDRMKSVDWPYASKAFENIAKFHALCMAYEEQNPEEYSAVSHKLTTNIEQAYKTMSNNFGSFVTKAVSETREENKEKLRNFFDRLLSTNQNVFKFSKPNRKAVLTHGDFRPSNIMHRVNEDGSLDLIPLDYQTLQTGCAQADLLYFLFTGSDAEFRAKYYHRLIDHYYDSLSQALSRLKLDPKKIYSREDFDYDLQEALPFGLVIGLFLLPVVTVDSADAPDLNDDDVWDCLSNSKTGPLYTSRINDVVDDYVRWGVL